MMRHFLLFAGSTLVVGCGTSGETSDGHWEGSSTADAGAPDATLSSMWPQSDPDPTNVPHGAPSFDADGGVSSGPTHCAAKTGTAGDHTILLTSNGLPRSSFVHVPSSYDPSLGTMIVLNFHGFTSNALEQIVLARMNPAADARKFIVVYPDGIASSWNAGDCCGDSWTNDVDDVKFTKDLLAKLEDDYCIDPKRIYAAGFSNGGFLAYRLACEMADVFAAVAPVAGAQGISPDQCHPSRPVPVLQFHGTSDFVVPYNGGTPISPIDFGGPITFRSVNDTTDIWRVKNGCLEEPHQIYQKGDATCNEWSGCRGGSDVTLCTIDGGGHAWPGGVSVPFLGKTSTDISATDTIVNFFLAHQMP